MQNAIRNLGGQVSPVMIEELGPDVQCYELHAGRPPLFIEPKGELLCDGARFQSWAAGVKDSFAKLIVQYGGIVLRGFPTPETDDFAKIADLFPAFEPGYAGGISPRTTIKGRVMEATRMQARQRLPLHSEMAYMRDYPKRIAFFCRQAAAVGGETIIGDMRNLVDDLPGDIVDKLERLGVRTTRGYGPKSDHLDQTVEYMEMIGWNIAFGTDDPAKAEALCAERGLTVHWSANGNMTVFNHTEPFVVHPLTGKKLYRSFLHIYTRTRKIEGENQEAVNAVRKTQEFESGTFLGNGESLTETEIEQFLACIDKVTYSWPWRNGDIMILDNLQVWHGRNPYQPGPRDVQVALFE